MGCDPPNGGMSCVFKMRADGTGQVNLTPEASLAGCPNQPGYFHRGASSEPSYSSDGAKIAFRGTVTCPHSSGTDIWVMGSDGGGKVNLTNDNGTSDTHPTFSPDGTKIAFNSSRPNGAPVGIYLIGASGGEVSRLASSSGFDNDPDWGAADVLAPTVAGVTPANSARNVSPRAKVTATFSEPMRASTVNDGSFVLRKKGAKKGVAAAVGYDPAAKKAWLDPKRDLRPGMAYTVTLESGATGAKDLATEPQDLVFHGQTVGRAEPHRPGIRAVFRNDAREVNAPARRALVDRASALPGRSGFRPRARTADPAWSRVRARPATSPRTLRSPRCARAAARRR